MRVTLERVSAYRWTVLLDDEILGTVRRASLVDMLFLDLVTELALMHRLSVTAGSARLVEMNIRAYRLRPKQYEIFARLARRMQRPGSLDLSVGL